MLIHLARIFLFACSALVSVRCADGYWVVGPVFGLAVIGWDSDIFRKIIPVRHLAFLAASTLIYALVYLLASQTWGRGSDLDESLLGPVPVAVIVGSALLPVAHKFLLKTSIKNAARAIPFLILSYYLVTFLSFVDDLWKFGLNNHFLLALIASWQGAYLYLLFPKK